MVITILRSIFEDNYQQVINEYRGYQKEEIRNLIRKLEDVSQRRIAMGIIPWQLVRIQEIKAREEQRNTDKVSKECMGQIINILWDTEHIIWKERSTLSAKEEDQRLRRKLANCIKSINVGNTINKRDEFIT